MKTITFPVHDPITGKHIRRALWRGLAVTFLVALFAARLIRKCIGRLR